MSPESQWISTVSMNRFYDHCYLIECAYHIISKYCCSFTNLLSHDDGSIPYYLVQKVKIAVEYGRILLNTRYRPFQQQLRLLGSFDYIDRFQYEGLCIHWNTIKTETQIVEMYFNQISLLIYPVVSSNALLSLNMVENSNVSALAKINALIQSLVGHDEMTICSSSSSSVLKNTTRLLSTDKTSVDCFSEEELGLFIVNNIIEPLFQDDANTIIGGPIDNNGPGKLTNGLFAGSSMTEGKCTTTRQNERKNIGEIYPIDDEMEANMLNDEFQLVTNNVLINDLYNLIGNDLFRLNDKLLSEILPVNSFESLFFSKNTSIDVDKPYTLVHDDRMSRNDSSSSRFGRAERDKDCRKDDVNFRLPNDHRRRPINQRKYQKRNASTVVNFDKKYPFEFVNKKFSEPLRVLSANTKNFI